MKSANFFSQRVDILIMPHRKAPLKIRLSMMSIILSLLCLAAAFLGACYVLVKNYDYQITRADNQLVKAKLALIAEELSRGRKYLELTRTTDAQMRSMLGMQAGADGGRQFEGEDKNFDFAGIFKKDASEIDESEYGAYLDDIEAAAKAQLASFQEIAWFYANKKNAADFTPSIRPTQGRLTSGFGYRIHPLRKNTRFHSGLDMADKPASPILVTADGVVRKVGWVRNLGQAVLVDHGFGYSTLYGHLAEIKVKPGDAVKRGDRIASMGTTGGSTGVHLHYEVWKDGKPVNPRAYFK